MGLHPPKLQDLSLWPEGSSKAVENVWEIGVPKTNSLFWSLVMSYLMAISDNKKFPGLLRNLTGNDEQVYKIKAKKKMKEGKINPQSVKKSLRKFNPFKNRHAFFHQSEEVFEVFRIFKHRLQNVKKKENDASDDSKLEDAASRLLRCKIDVYFPEETQNKRVISYPKTKHHFKERIILFQYGIEKLGNVFGFAMTTQYAHNLKLDALVHVLKIAKVDPTDIKQIKEILYNPEDHGSSFLCTVLKNGCYGILPKVYKSSYTALKLTEAGFETDPTVTHGEIPSALYYAANFKDTAYIQILYNFALNCQSCFDRSSRRGDDIALEGLERLKVVLEKDCKYASGDSIKDSGKAAEHILKQFLLFNKYQHESVSHLSSLKNCSEDKFESRKETIDSILKCYYSKYFLDPSMESANMSDLFAHHFIFNEYYKIFDSHACASFFDHFYRLRLCIGLKRPYVFLNIEWKMFLAMMSKRYFLEAEYMPNDNETERKPKRLKVDDKRNDEKISEKENVLCYIPLLHRCKLKIEIKEFLGKLKSASSPQCLEQSLKNEALPNNPHASSEIIDELLWSRLEMHMKEAIEVSTTEGGKDKCATRAVLIIERALQMLGESIKTDSPNSGNVSFLLKSCLSTNLQNNLMKIRDDTSHYRNLLAHGRLTIEKKLQIFEGIKEELKKMKESFKVVDFTQRLRAEESIMLNSSVELKGKVSQDVWEDFNEKWELRVYERKKKYENFHDSCMQLLHANLSDLQIRIRNKKSKSEEIFGQLKSIEHLLSFIWKHKPDGNLDNLKSDVKMFSLDYEKKDLDDFKSALTELLDKCISRLPPTNSEINIPLTAPNIESLLSEMKTSLFKDNEIKHIEETILDAYEEAIDSNSRLQDLIHENKYQSADEVKYYLRNILIPSIKMEKLKNFLDSKDEKHALGLLNKKWIEKEKVKEDIRLMCLDETLEDGIGKKLKKNKQDSNISDLSKTLLKRITFQEDFASKIYKQKLSKEIQGKLEIFLTKKVRFLIDRLDALKSILIHEDEEIEGTWMYGKSEAIKHHTKFLMRHRYMTEMAVRASLDMAFFDCVNILEKDSLKELYEKSTDLFAGINLRNVVAHRNCIPETIGDILDADDFPSAMIDKMLELVEDSDGIKSMLKLFLKIGELEEEDFLSIINKEIDNLHTDSEKSNPYKNEIKDIAKCKRWKEYLFLLPFIK